MLYEKEHQHQQDHIRNHPFQVQVRIDVFRSCIECINHQLCNPIMMIIAMMLTSLIVRMMMNLLMIYYEKNEGLDDLSAQSQLINLSISANLEAAIDAAQSFNSCIISQI